jgi:hypothetical protein
VDRVRHIDRLDRKQRGVENELGRENRPQQRMMEDERRAFAQFDKRVTRRTGQGRRFADAGEENHRTRRQQRGDRERQAAADPADQCAAECWARCERDRARKLDPAIGNWQCIRLDERRHERGRRDAERNGAACTNKAKDRKQEQVQPAQRHQCRYDKQRNDPKQFGTRHQARARHAVRPHTGGDREQQEWQRLRGLQDAGRGFAGAAARPTCSANCAAKLDQARRWNAGGSGDFRCGLTVHFFEID